MLESSFNFSPSLLTPSYTLSALMGICSSGPTGNSAANNQPTARDAKTHRIDAHLDEQAKVENKIKLLLLGPGESGKSTLFKQIQTIYGEGFTQDQLKSSAPQVHNNTMLCLKALADNCVAYGEISEQNEDIVEYLQKITEEHIESAQLEAKYIAQYQAFWRDPVCQETWRNRSNYQIYGCAQYLIERIDAIVKPDYIPSLEDLLQIRVRTTGIVETIFTVDHTSMKLVDVGGQRNERRKWIHCFENVTAVIFVAAISEYDQQLFEDNSVNRLDEALLLFEEVCNTTYFVNIPILLFLNKSDLFEDKVNVVPLSKHHPSFPGPDFDYTAASDWIAEQFRAKNLQQRNKIVYCTVTSAVQRSVVRDLFVSVKDIVVRQTMASVGVQ